MKPVRDALPEKGAASFPLHATLALLKPDAADAYAVRDRNCITCYVIHFEHEYIQSWGWWSVLEVLLHTPSSLPDGAWLPSISPSPRRLRA